MKDLMTTKLVWLFGCMATFIIPIREAMIATAVLIVIDLIMGVAAAVAKGGFYAINSKELSRTLIKMFSYQVIIISAHLIKLYFLPLLPIVEVTLAFIGVTELLSIGENFYTLTGQNFAYWLKTYLFDKMKQSDIRKDDKPKT